MLLMLIMLLMPMTLITTYNSVQVMFADAPRRALGESPGSGTETKPQRRDAFYSERVRACECGWGGESGRVQTQRGGEGQGGRVRVRPKCNIAYAR